MSEYMTHHSKMEEALIEEFVRKYSVEGWLKAGDLLKKEDYYHFNRTLKEI